MDAGTGFTAQVYNLTQQFLPKEWIMEKWEEGYYITAMAGSMSGSSLVVMSKGTPYTQQSYKVGFFLGVGRGWETWDGCWLTGCFHCSSLCVRGFVCVSGWDRVKGQRVKGRVQWLSGA